MLAFAFNYGTSITSWSWFIISLLLIAFTYAIAISAYRRINSDTFTNRNKFKLIIWIVLLLSIFNIIYIGFGHGVKKGKEVPIRNHSLTKSVLQADTTTVKIKVDPVLLEYTNDSISKAKELERKAELKAELDEIYKQSI